MKVFALDMRFYESHFIFLVNAKADPFFSTKNGKPLYRKRKTTCLPPASEALLFGSRPSSGLILRMLFLARLTNSSVDETAWSNTANGEPKTWVQPPVGTLFSKGTIRTIEACYPSIIITSIPFYSQKCSSLGDKIIWAPYDYVSHCTQDTSPNLGFTCVQWKQGNLIYRVVITMKLDNVLQAWFPEVPLIPLNTSYVLKRSTFRKRRYSVREVLILDCQFEDLYFPRFIAIRSREW